MAQSHDTRERAPQGARSALWAPSDVLLAAAGFALLTGGIEALVHLVQQRVLQRTIVMGGDFLWQLPLADLLIFLTVGLLIVLGGALWRPLRTARVVIAILAGLAGFALLLLTERIHVLVEVFLGLVLGVALARLLGPRSDGLRRVLRVAVPVVVLGFGALAAALQIGRSAAERRGVAALAAAPAGSPNILLLILDTVRAWNFGLYGYPRATTPRIREWASQGTVFQRALAPAPWTTLSHAVMFTGRHPTELSVRWERPLDATFPTLAQVLQDAGYLTAGFVANYTQAGTPTGLAQGFLHYEDYPFTVVSLLRHTSLLRRLVNNDQVGRLVGRRRMLEGKVGADVNAAFLRWEEAHRGRPWFAFLNYYDAHGPYLPPAPFDTMYSGADSIVRPYWQRLLQAYGSPPLPGPELAQWLDGYDGGIRYLDGQVDALLRALAERGQLANTVVVITSDHGELFGEHGVITHGNNLYLPVLYIPLVMLGPGRVPRGERIQSLASLRDLPATLLALAGVKNPGLPGVNLARLWQQPDSVAPDTLFALVEYNRRLPKWPPSPVLRGTMFSVVLDSLHYIMNGDGKEELYAMGRDSWEVRNLVGAPEFAVDLERHRGALKSLLQR